VKCTYPKTIKIGNQKKTVPCGKCIACKCNRSQEWYVRLVHEMSVHKEMCFVTLTYNEDNIKKNYSLNKKDLVDFFKRLRYYYKENKIKYYACGEYGDTTYRPHYHMIIFEYQPTVEEMYLLRIEKGIKRMSSEILDKIWFQGQNTVDIVNLKTIRYTVKYITKKLYGEKAKEVYGDNEPPFSLMSKGLGLNWIESTKEDHEDMLKGYLTIEGKKVPIPRYYQKKYDFIGLKDPKVNYEKIKDLDVELSQDKFYRLGRKVVKGELTYEKMEEIIKDDLEQNRRKQKRMEEIKRTSL